MTDDDTPRASHPILEAVIIAGLSALVTGLANWAVERLTKRKARKKRTTKETKTP